MIITDMQWETLEIPMQQPFKIAFAELTASTSILLKITTDEGLTGYGEAAPFAPVTGETADSVRSALSLFRPGLIGMDAMDIEGIHALMDRIITHNTSAKCAVDLALYDLRGKLMNQPLYKVLGGSCPEVLNDVTIGIQSPRDMAEEALSRVQQGFTILKIKAGIDPDADIEALTLIRQTVGDTIRLRVDANQGYETAAAVRTLNRMLPLGIEAVEQCLPAWDLEGSAYVRAHAQGIKIMLDESLHGPRDAFQICSRGAADCMNIKLMKCGGIYPALKIAAIGEVSGVTCMVGCMMESKIAITAGISLAAARNVITEADCDSFLYAKDPEMGMQGGYSFEGSRFLLTEKPGLGLDIDF